MAKKKAKVKTKPKTTVVATAKNTDLAKYTGKKDAWGAGTKVESDEILIPKLLLLQANADMVTRKGSKLKGGAIVHSVDEELIATQPTNENPIELIIFDSFKTRYTYKDDKFLKSEPWLPEFRDRGEYPFEGKTINGALMKWREARHYIGLRPADIGTQAVFPYVVTMKGLSIKVASKLATMFAKLAAFNVPSAAFVINLSIDQETTDNGTFWVWRVAKGRKTTNTELMKCKEWYDTMQLKNVVVDETKETESDGTSVNTASDPDTASRPARTQTTVSAEDVRI